MNRSEPTYVNSEKSETSITTTQEFNNERSPQNSPPAWQNEEKRKRNPELTKLTTLTPSIPTNFSPFLIPRGGGETLTINEEEFITSNYYPNNYQNYTGQCLPSTYQYWPHQQYMYNFPGYPENCWQN